MHIHILYYLKAIDLFAKIRHNFVHRDANLLGGIPVPDGDGVVFLDGIKIDRYAVRNANLVCSAISSSDGAGSIPLDIVAHLDFLKQITSCLDKRLLILYEGQNGRLDRGNTGIKLEEGALFATNLVLGISRANQGQDQTINSQRRLNHMRNVFLFGLLIKVFEA